jgi:hypothetical protein
LRNGDKQAPQLIYIQYGGGAAAQVHGVDIPVEVSGHLFSRLASTYHVRTDAVHVALKNGAGEDIGGEVAVTAFGAAERHRNIQTQRHRRMIIPLCLKVLTGSGI